MNENNLIIRPFYLLRKQIILIITVCIFFCITTHAQPRELNRPDHDNLPYYFGIYLAYNSTYLHPSKDKRFLANDSILTAEPGASGGVALGFLATLKLNNRWEFRLNPS